MIQLAMIDRVRLLSQKHAAISSVLMYGSFAKGEGDEYSDIEFYIFLNPEVHFNKKRWLNSIEKTEFSFVNEFGTEVTIFRNLIRGEFHFLDANQIGIIKSWVGMVSFEYWKHMIVVDKDNKLRDIFSAITKKRPLRNTPENLLWIQRSFINVALFTKNLLLRKEWAHAHQQFFFLHKYLLWLIRIKVDSTAHWESPTKKAEEDLPALWYSMYTECTSALEAENLHAAFLNCVDLAATLFGYFKATGENVLLLKKITEKR